MFHQAALGDFVLSFPLLASLRRRGEAVTVVSHPSHARLAARLFDHVSGQSIDAAPWSSLFATACADGGRLADADRVISFVSSGEDAWAKNVRRLAPHAELRCVRPRPPAEWVEHVTAWHARQLDMTAPEPPRGCVRREDGPIVVHPGSGGVAKCWPLDRFAALIERLRRAAPVRVIAGEAEVERGTLPEAEILTSLDALHETLDAASLYIGNDAGPTHLAAWLGVPTLALFGPTDPRLWRPFGPAVTVLAPPKPRPIDWLELETVHSAAIRLVHDRPR